MGHQRIIYMDHSATTYIKKEVVDAMIPYFTQHFGNPSSIYGIARESKDCHRNGPSTGGKSARGGSR